MFSGIVPVLYYTKDAIWTVLQDIELKNDPTVTRSEESPETVWFRGLGAEAFRKSAAELTEEEKK